MPDGARVPHYLCAIPLKSLRHDNAQRQERNNDKAGIGCYPYPAHIAAYLATCRPGIIGYDTPEIRPVGLTLVTQVSRLLRKV